jgi:hypothetical protein
MEEQAKPERRIIVLVTLRLSLPLAPVLLALNQRQQNLFNHPLTL